uniref:Uncharacterized protein n=1 Tax=Panagrolaimus davidi TaxID=227884 RepID=A0A914Q3A7_9BILA
MTCKGLTGKKLENCCTNNILIDSNQFQDLSDLQNHSNLLHRQLSNGIKQSMEKVEACTIIDNTISSLSRSLNMFAEKVNV